MGRRRSKKTERKRKKKKKGNNMKGKKYAVKRWREREREEGKNYIMKRV